MKNYKNLLISMTCLPSSLVTKNQLKKCQ